MGSASRALVMCLGLTFFNSYATGACPGKPDQTIGADFMSQADLTCYQAPSVMLKCDNQLYGGSYGSGARGGWGDLRPQYARAARFRDWDRSVPLAFHVSCAPVELVRVSVHAWRPEPKPACCEALERDADDDEAAACCGEWPADNTVEVASLETWDDSTYPWPEDLPPGDYGVEVHVVPQEVSGRDSTYSFLIRLSSDEKPSAPAVPEAPTCYAITLSDWTQVDDEGRTRQVTPEPSWLMPSRIRLEWTGRTADEWQEGWLTLAARPDGVAVDFDHFRLGGWDLTDTGGVEVWWPRHDGDVRLRLDSLGETTKGKAVVGSFELGLDPASEVGATRVNCRAPGSPK